jgi:phosphatidylglycerophosphate synthase
MEEFENVEEIAQMDFVFGVIITFILISTILIYTTSPVEIGEEEKKRVEKEAEGFGLSGIKNIYRTLGGYAYWIADKLKFVSSIPPDTISWIGFSLNLLASVLIPFRIFSFAGLLFIIGGILDIVDGYIARRKRRTTLSGALTDSFLDRVSEISMFLGSLIFFSLNQQKISVVLTALALSFSLLVSYVKARAESLGYSPGEGVGRRQERVVIFSISLLLDSIFSYFTGKTIFLNIGVFAIFILSFITSITRFRQSYKYLAKSSKSDTENEKEKL